MPPKKTSKWITHVKSYAKANNCSYSDALSRASHSYQSGTGFLSTAHAFVKKHKIISRGANFIANSGYAGKHADTVRRVGNLAGANGYGKRRQNGKGGCISKSQVQPTPTAITDHRRATIIQALRIPTTDHVIPATRPSSRHVLSDQEAAERRARVYQIKFLQKAGLLDK